MSGHARGHRSTAQVATLTSAQGDRSKPAARGAPRTGACAPGLRKCILSFLNSRASLASPW
eukprot:1682894-Pyramimonas_sp.AAC.1